jgi:hypothetical protein
MPHLDFVALREPVTCTLPTDPPGHKRLVRQFRRLELEKFELGQQKHKAGDAVAALDLFDELCRFAVEGVTDTELSALAIADKVRLLGAAMGKLELVEAALGNAQSGGAMEAAPPMSSQDSSTTTGAAPPLAG